MPVENPRGTPRPLREFGGKFFAPFAVFAFFLIAAPAGLSAQTSPEDRAVQYLMREVPRWRQEHPCYSCHNNGDAARALIAARTKDHALGTALDDTLVWLRSPSRWDANATGGGFDDKPLARIQFAGALASASAAKLTPPASIRAAAQLVAADQAIDGSKAGRKPRVPQARRATPSAFRPPPATLALIETR
jgi:hypothetical protein